MVIGEIQVSLDVLTKRLTMFDTFGELLDAPGGYRPTFNPRTRTGRMLADAYDRAQQQRGDGRKAFRW